MASDQKPTPTLQEMHKMILDMQANLDRLNRILLPGTSNRCALCGATKKTGRDSRPVMKTSVTTMEDKVIPTKEVQD